MIASRKLSEESMIRRFGLAVLVTALIVAACGRQVTFPKYAQSGGLSSGFMSVRFTVYAPFNFSSYDYIVVFNTTGNGLTPLPNGGAQANYSAFSDALIVSGNSSGAVQAVPVQYVTSSGTSLPPVVFPLNPPAQDFIFNSNSNALGTQFQITFLRAIFSNVASTSPSPSPSPSATPASTWTFNCFTTGQAPNYTPVDSLGAGGATDTTFVSPLLNIHTTFDITQNALGTIAPSQSAQIVSCEISNTP